MNNNQYDPFTHLSVIMQTAKELVSDGGHPEYLRAICELIASIDGKEDMPTADRAIEIAHELGIEKEDIELFY